MFSNKLPHEYRWSTKYYGSRRGLVITLWHQMLYFFGRYHVYKNINWSKVERLVFICKGNICRSACAEEIAHNLNIESISFGLKTADNLPANKDAILAAARLGINLDLHKTNTAQSISLKKTDLLLVMEPWQARELNKLFDNQYQCSLLGLWASPALPHIQDPYGYPPVYFETCFIKIRNAVQHIAGKIV